MDLTTLALFFSLVASIVSADAVMHPTSVVIEASIAGKLDKLTVDAEILTEMLNFEVTQICVTRSLVALPEVRTGANKGIGMAIAEAAKMQSVALALQAQFGNQPEQIKLALLGEGTVTKALLSGSGLGGHIRTPAFQEMILVQPNESLEALVRRVALLAMKKIDPYITALFLVRSHIGDADFSEAQALIDTTTAKLPQTPVNADRSALENLQGMIAMFGGKLDEANGLFHRASQSDPANAAAALNGGFVDVQLGQYEKAAQHIGSLLEVRPPQNKILLAAAYVTWAAALFGREDVDGAESKLARAVEIDPLSAEAYDFWSAIKRTQGDITAANSLHAKAWQAAQTARTYTEVAALYYRLATQPNQKLVRSPYYNPTTIRYN